MRLTGLILHHKEGRESFIITEVTKDSIFIEWLKYNYEEGCGPLGKGKVKDRYGRRQEEQWLRDMMKLYRIDETQRVSQILAAYEV